VRVLLVAGAIVTAGLGLLGWKLAHRPDATAIVPVEAAARRTIAVTIEATGTVEPINLVEIKSKASGLIVQMPVEVGSVVHAGDLLAQIDKRDVQNQYDQSLAQLHAAQSRVDITGAQKQRSEDLFAKQVLTADEHDTATLASDNSQADLVKARTDLDLARQRLEDATVRAPIAGTVIEQVVTAGQVISSATSSASGGTSLLKMADLSRIRMRALVSETDIGSVHPGQTATVSVDAFPRGSFTGTVEKIEPQAVVQQSVTLFPVLISISNEKGLLLPGMNGEISMLVAQQDDALSIPLDAVRSVRELPALATALGLDPGSVRALLQQQAGARPRDRGGARAGADSLRQRGAWRGHGVAGADSSARARWRARAGGGAAGGAGSPGASAGASGAGAGRAGSRAQAVLVKTAHGLEPRLVRLGLSNFDYAQVLDGVQEGEEVALLGVAEVQATRQQDQDRMRQRLGAGVPGAPGAGGGGGGRGAGGGR
jgi:HlyD family secretion protein